MLTSSSTVSDCSVELSSASEEPPGRPPALQLAATIRELSDRLLAAQRPLRVLEALRWPAEAERAFLAKNGRELPRVTRATYNARPLHFDVPTKHAELIALRAEVERRLGG